MLFLYKKKRYLLILLSLTELTYLSVLHAEIVNNVNTSFIRVRYGTNSGSIDTVIYEPLIPTEFNGLAGITTQASTMSTTAIAGGSGTHRVRIVTDLNAKGPVAAPLTGIFSYDSSNPLTCTTPAFCGATTINFSKISWSARDADTLHTVTQYNNAAIQVFQTQTDTDHNNKKLNPRHKNYYRFEYLNDTLLPAGTYEGTVVINGSAPI